jgi:hypothetical protein
MDICTAALRSGIERDYPDRVYELDNVAKEMAYYGDLTNALLESQGKRYDESLDLGDRSNALNYLRAIPTRNRFGIRQYDRLPGKSALREFAADIAAPFLGMIGLTMPLIASVSKDAAEYLSGNSDFAEKLRERVRNKLCAIIDRGDNILLISHGMGCIVAFDVLWELSHDPRWSERYGESKVGTWLTLGSPLGDNHIRKYLLGSSRKSANQFPTNIISWHNVSAEDDYVCHDNTLADDFKKMMHHRLVSTVKDYHVYNLALRYGKSNPHSSVGYYIHPRVAKIVTDWLSSDRVSEMPIYTL